ncbi:MAG: DsbA family oxidoreductase [Ilumatobacteraceae bacterium]
MPGPTHVEFYFDTMCPFAYHTSRWIREVRALGLVEVSWRFFSLEEVNRKPDQPHAWERETTYGWGPLRVAAWLRRIDMRLCDEWYRVAGRALHEEGRRPYEEATARELLAEIGAPADAWRAAHADATTHDDVRREHDRAVGVHGGFGVPMIVFPDGRPLFGPVVVPIPEGDAVRRLWEQCVAFAATEGLWELKRPKTAADIEGIKAHFDSYLGAREWKTVMRPAP